MNIRMQLLGLVLSTVCGVTLAEGDPRPVETVAPKFMHEIPNIPGKSLIAVEVTYPPRGASPSHRHARSAFIYAYVLEGEIKSSVNGSAPHVYKAGESWFEEPGAHHTVSQNVSDTRPARLLAVFVADTDDKELTVPDL